METSKSHRNIFKEICDGYSIVDTEFGIFYVKHLSYSDNTELENLHDKFFNEAKKRGLPTVEDSLENLKQEGFWSAKKEAELKEQESFLLKLINNKKNIYLKSQLDVANSQIQQCQDKINILKNERHRLLGNTCENHADQKLTEEFIRFTFFKDKQFQILAFSEEQFEELDIDSLSHLVTTHNTLANNFSELVLQKLVLEDFFSYYMPFCEDPIHFYGQPVVKLTHNQLRLLIYARYFKNILQSSDKIPEDYRKDPEKLIDYVNANEKAKKTMQNKEGQATSIVGATKEDYEYLNLNKGEAKHVSLKEEAKKKGGTLNMKDLMKMMGQD